MNDRLPPRVLTDLLRARSADHPHHPALRQDGRILSYGLLARQTEQAASQLWHGWGVRAGDRVALLAMNRIEQIVLLFALARIGAMLVPLNYRLAGPELDSLLQDCRPVCLVHDATWQDAAQALGARAALPVHALSALCAAPADPGLPELGASDRAALLVYTSGTTGRARGALHTQANLLANMAAAVTVQGLRPDDLVATILPLFHVGGLCIQTLPALYAGATVTLAERFDPQACLRCIETERVTLTLQVPATLRALIGDPGWAGTDLSSLRAVWAGSSILPGALIKAFHVRGVPVCNVYGSTESGPFSVALPADQARSHVGSCGWPAPGVQARLVDLQGGIGEICLRGPAIAQTCWPDLSAVDAEGWLHTGDLAGQADDGSYRIVGRARDMIISGGENIYPAEIENLLGEHPAVAECVVLGRPDEQWGEVVLGAVVPAPGATFDEQQLLDYLRPRLARYKLPRRLHAVPQLPKTALGKVQKHLLLAALV
jgi:fatty-acyl-CoA synthase